MKSFRLIALTLLATALSASLAAQAVTPASPLFKKIEPTRIAYINSAVFLNPEAGIKQLVRASQALDLEFAGVQSELALLGEKLRTLAAEINQLAADQVANAEAIATKQAEGRKLQQELQTKQQQAQASYNEREQALQGPIITDIGTELRTYSQERGVGLLLDVSKLGDALLDADPTLDLTVDFVAAYNSKHP